MMKLTKPMSAAGILLFALLCAYPVNWLRIFGFRAVYPASLEMFTLPLLALTALAGILFQPGRLLAAWRRDRLSRRIIVLALFVALTQTVLAVTENWSTAQWGTTFFYLLLPLAGAAYSSELRKLFPYFFGLLALGALALLIAEFLQRVPVPIGLGGNWNWNQTLLWISVPVLPALLPFKKRVLTTAAASLVILPCSMLFFPEHTSLGTVLAATGALVVIFLLFCIPSPKRRLALGIGGTLAAAFLFFAVLEFSTWNPVEYPAAGKLLRDTRLQLWRGGVQMALGEGALGAGAARTEFILPLYLPGDYYFSMYASDRHPHPHNEALFYFGAFGIAGAAFGLLLVSAALRGIRRAGKHDFLPRLLGWGFLVLLFHGMLDVLLGEALPGGIALLLAGMFWGYRLPSLSGFPRKHRARLPVTTRWNTVIAALLFFSAIVTAAVNLYSGILFYRAQTARLQNDIDSAEKFLHRSIGIQPKAESLAFAGRIALFDRKNPQQAIDCFRRLEAELHIPHYSHTAQWLGRAHAASGNLAEALRCFDLEDRYFPAGALTAGLRLTVLRQLKVTRSDLQKAELDFRARMQLKGMEPEDFNLLLRYPGIDDNAAERLHVLKHGVRR